jgi:hypothetical protein
MTPSAGSRLSVRIVRANLLVAAVTALSLAAVATAAAHWIWRARESRRVAESAKMIAEAVRIEADEEHHALARAAADVFEESAVPEYRFEAWRGGVLVARSRPGAVVGPPSNALASSREWIVASGPIDAELTVLVAAPRDAGPRALRLFGLSLATAVPLCLLVAALTGGASPPTSRDRSRTSASACWQRRRVAGFRHRRTAIRRRKCETSTSRSRSCGVGSAARWRASASLRGTPRTSCGRL